MSRSKDLQRQVHRVPGKTEDAEVLHHTLADPTKEVKEHERERYEKLCREPGLQRE